MGENRARLQRQLHLLRQQLVVLDDDLLVLEHIQHQHGRGLRGNRSRGAHRASTDLLAEHHALGEHMRRLVVDAFLAQETVGQVDFYVA